MLVYFFTYIGTGVSVSPCPCELGIPITLTSGVFCHLGVRRGWLIMIVSLVLLGPVVCVCKGTGIDLNENRSAED